MNCFVFTKKWRKKGWKEGVFLQTGPPGLVCFFHCLQPLIDNNSSTGLRVPGSPQNSGQWTVVSTEHEGAKTTFPSCLGLQGLALKACPGRSPERQ